MGKRIGDSIYHTTGWRRLRAYVYGREHGICQRCGDPGDVVHHKIAITAANVNDPNVTMNAQLLELLCHQCHNREHKAGEDPVREDCAFDEFGQLVKREKN
ncbi:HNH endonuclease [Bacillus luteus]|uniref:HNH endonuclease n=1 Tax=Alkalicoccus luteus TaxID=1237094 RepID=A0A969PMZ5_9BACI|nr:HNH endonuclease [Alkalicoccus luteus]